MAADVTSSLTALFEAGDYRSCRKGYTSLLESVNLSGKPAPGHPAAAEVAAAYGNMACCSMKLGKVRVWRWERESPTRVSGVAWLHLCFSVAVSTIGAPVAVRWTSHARPQAVHGLEPIARECIVFLLATLRGVPLGWRAIGSLTAVCVTR